MSESQTPQPEPRLDYGAPPAPPGSRALRRVFGVLLMLLVFPAAFGFLASFEPFPNAIVWRAGYAAFGLACLATGSWLLLKK